jgi:hypothetical protein
VIIFSIRAALGYSSKWYVVFGIITMGLLALSLRPNIDRLIHGNERLVGLRAWLKKKGDSPEAQVSSTADQQNQH